MSKYLYMPIQATDSLASMVASPGLLSKPKKSNGNDHLTRAFQNNRLKANEMHTWKSFKSLQYGSVRLHPITHAFNWGWCWHISNNAFLTAPCTVSTTILYRFEQSRMNSSISSNGLFGCIYKHINFTSGYFSLNNVPNRCNSTVQSFPPLNDRKISFGSYFSSVSHNI